MCGLLIPFAPRRLCIASGRGCFETNAAPMKAKTKKRHVDPARIKKLWKLLDLGLKDLRKQERAKNSAVFMGKWIVPASIGWDGKCWACLAGSVMRWSCGLKIEPDRIPPWALALNDLRCGRVVFAADSAFLDCSLYVWFDRDISAYDGPDGQWWRDMEQLRDDLKEADL